MKNGKQALEYNEKHTTTIMAAHNQTTQDLLKFVSNPTSLGMVPVKRLYERSKYAVE
jgi:hypothetical protein